jgi:hypothetical protein
MKILFFLLLPAISLAQDTVKLNEVVVKSKRPLIQMDIDKVIVNVGSMISSATSNALEVLEKTPGVTVNASGDITLNGRGGILVLIDGRPTHMSGQDLANYLKSLPGGLLDKIELIDNPPAKYDAGGNAVINIRLKKNKVSGFTGSISSGFTQGEYMRGNHSLSLNYNHKKINLFGNMGYSHEKTYSQDNFTRHFYDSTGTTTILLDNHQISVNKGLYTSLGMDYSATKNTTYGVQLSISNNNRTGDLNSNSTESKGHTSGKDTRTNIVTNLNMLHKFGTSGKELSADVNYLQYHSTGDQSLQNQTSSDYEEFRYRLPSDMNIYSVKADYLHPFSKTAKLEAGFKASSSKNDNPADYYQMIDKQPVIDNSRSNHFKYHENLYAAYISAQKSWKRAGVQLGLRAEQTVADGEQIVTKSTFSKRYLQLFPSLFVNYKLDTLGKNTLAFSITRRINRPNYQLLNPFLFFRDQYSYSSGNPLLDPQYQFRYELKYQYKQRLRMSLSYNRFSNVIFQTTNVIDKVLITKPENVNKGFMLLLNTGLSFTPAKWWNLNTDILLSRMGLNGTAYGVKLNPETYVARINVLNQFQFGTKWSAELGAYYASADLNGQTFTAGMIRSNFGIQKKILKDKGSIRVSMDDIFHSWVYKNHSVSLKNADYSQISFTDTQRVGIAFTYAFGKDTFTGKSRHRDNALDDEKSRLQ